LLQPQSSSYSDNKDRSRQQACKLRGMQVQSAWERLMQSHRRATWSDET
jgi:hypothetical protein